MEENIFLKRIFSRKLKNGKYVIVATDSEPLVVDKETMNKLNEDINLFKEWNQEIFSIFKNSGFFLDTETDTNIIAQKNNVGWIIARYGLFLIAIFSILGIIFTIPFVGIVLGGQIIVTDISVGKSIIYVILVSLITTAIHEVMHMIFAHTWGKKVGGLRIKLKSSIATVSMNHIWCWSLIGRLSAVTAGIVSDLFLLFLCSILRLYFDNWELSALASILWVRILWQFRFNRNSDGRLIAMMSLDNPIISESVDDPFVKKSEVITWKILNGIGIIVEIIIVVGWIIPFILDICSFTMIV